MINDNNNEDFYCASATVSPAGFTIAVYIVKSYTVAVYTDHNTQ